jgi:hypothetical protein
MAQLHRLYRCLIEYVNASSTHTLLQVVRSERLSLHIEVGDVKLKCGAQSMSHHLLLKTSARHLAPQKFGDYVYLTLRKLVSSHYPVLFFGQRY